MTVPEETSALDPIAKDGSAENLGSARRYPLLETWSFNGCLGHRGQHHRREEIAVPIDKATVA
jgi:hypothetical protein